MHSEGICNGPNEWDEGVRWINHAVVVLGYGVEDGIDFYLIKNSLGPYWAEGGYAKVRCHLLSNFMHPIIDDDYIFTITADKRKADILGKENGKKHKKVAETASKLTIEGAAFCGTWKGTSRPAHCHVLTDEIGFSPDELQNLIRSLSYVYQRSTCAISIVAQICYAHLAATLNGAIYQV